MSDFDAMDEILREFLVESYESLDSLDSDLIVLEEEPESAETLGKVFRTIHSIKGTSGVLGFSKLERVTHVGENLLSRMRDGQLTFDQAIATALLQMVDAVREMLACIESDGEDGSQDYGALIKVLEQLLDGSAEAPTATAEPAPTEPVHVDEAPEEQAASSSAVEAPEAQEAAVGQDASEVADSPVDPVDVASTSKPATDSAEGLPEPEGAEASSEDKEAGSATSERTEKSGGSVSESTVRVDVKLLDQLMNQVGELVLARNRILQYGATSGDPGLQSTVQGLNLITSELQEEVMKTRMQPIGSIWNKFPRAIRDLCVAFEKKVNLVMEGRETELDRTLIEAIKDPLTHAIRNSVDHGIETPEERLKAGKSFTGTVRLRAYHEGGQVSIELWDDGAGIDPCKVAAKAMEKGIVTQEEVDRMTDRELIHLVFAPGFSTAAKVTNVSGRGVGMDVVRTNIEQIGGTVELKSEVGQWTELKIKIPLTLAIIPALVVNHRGGRYAIPQASLVELLRLGADQAEGLIESVQGARVYRLRGQLLPLVHLGEVLGLDGPHWPGEDIEEGDEHRSWNIVVLHCDDQTFGLVVDGISDTEEIVVKPLGKQLKEIPVFAGATIMGDGNVALILDILGIAKETEALGGGGNRRDLHDAGDEGLKLLDGTTMILVEVGQGERMALPLSSVSRLEEFETAAIEHSGGREVIQYRDRIMPLARLDDLVGRSVQRDDGEHLQVVVNGENETSVGIVVSRILDILETEVDADAGDLPGAAVIGGRVTEIVDTARVLANAGYQEATR